MARREVTGRYRGSMIGLAWSLLNPLLMLLAYTFVFSIVFNARWGNGTSENRTDFAMIMFVGLIIHGIFAECINRAPTLIPGNANYIKKVVFPLEILPWITLLASLFHAAANLLILLIALTLFGRGVPWTVLLFPLILVPFAMTTLGIAWFLSALGVYVRDVAHTTGLLTTLLLFVSPVFYPVSALPETYRDLMMFNPLTFVIEESRKILIYGHLPDWSGLSIYFAIACLVAWAGFWWFQKSRRGFADVL